MMSTLKKKKTSTNTKSLEKNIMGGRVMNKKRLIIISSVVVAVIVAMALLVTSVFADTPTPVAGTATNPEGVFAAKVAGILGIDQAQVEAAFTQARQEIRSDAEADRLAKQVAAGKLTQEQADQYKAWLDSRPDVPALLGPQGGQDGRGGMMRGGMMGRGLMERSFGERCTGENCPAATTAQ